jgi:hypothetical protein
MFRVLADALERAVPAVRKSRVSVESEGVAVIDGERTAGTGYKLYEAAVVKTMRKVKFGFESDKYVVNKRRKEFVGNVCESIERRDEPSGCMTDGFETALCIRLL